MESDVPRYGCDVCEGTRRKLSQQIRDLLSRTDGTETLNQDVVCIGVMEGSGRIRVHRSPPHSCLRRCFASWCDALRRPQKVTCVSRELPKLSVLQPGPVPSCEPPLSTVVAPAPVQAL